MADSKDNSKPPRRAKKVDRLTAGAMGIGQGLFLNWLDEIMRATGDEASATLMADAERQHPLSFGAGNLGGGLFTGFMGTRLATRGARGLDLIARAAAADGGLGVALGAGGYDPGEEETIWRRLGDGALGGAIGAGVGAAAPMAARYAPEVARNMRVLSGKPSPQAPRSIRPMGGDWSEIIDEALARDAAMRASAKLAGAPSGATALDLGGEHIESLFSAALRDPKARQAALAAEERLLMDAASRRAALLRPPSAGADTLGDDASRLLDTLYDSRIGKPWADAVAVLPGDQLGALSRAAVQRVRADLSSGDAEAARLVAEQLQSGPLAKKLKALGLDPGAATKSIGRLQDLRVSAIYHGDAPDPSAPDMTVWSGGQAPVGRYGDGVRRAQKRYDEDAKTLARWRGADAPPDGRAGKKIDSGRAKTVFEHVSDPSAVMVQIKRPTDLDVEFATMARDAHAAGAPEAAHLPRIREITWGEDGSLWYAADRLTKQPERGALAISKSNGRYVGKGGAGADELAVAMQDIESALTPRVKSVFHGDAHRDNIMLAADGRAVLNDPFEVRRRVAAQPPAGVVKTGAPARARPALAADAAALRARVFSDERFGANPRRGTDGRRYRGDVKDRAPLQDAEAVIDLLTRPRPGGYIAPSYKYEPLYELESAPGMHWTPPGVVADSVRAAEALAWITGGKVASVVGKPALHGDGVLPWVFDPRTRDAAAREREAALDQSAYQRYEESYAAALELWREFTSADPPEDPDVLIEWRDRVLAERATAGTTPQ